MRLAFSRSDPWAAPAIDPAGLISLYRHPLPPMGRVHLRTNFVQSLDGAVAGADGRSGSINTPSDQHVFALHRAHADAIIVGAQTVRAEGYRAVDLAPWQHDIRADLGLVDFPTLVIISGSLNLDPVIAVPVAGTGGPVVIITTERADPAKISQLTAAGIAVLALGRSVVDLSQTVRHLAAAGLRRLLCEGGPRLHRSLLAADLVDELSLTLAPLAVGGDGPRSAAGQFLPDPRAFVLASVVVAEDNTLLLRYLRDR